LRLARQRKQWRVADLSDLWLFINIRASFPAWKVREGIQTRVEFTRITAALPALLYTHITRLIQRKRRRCKMSRGQRDV